MSQLGFMMAVFGLGHAASRRSPGAWCCSPTGSTRRRRSWWSASSTTSTAHATRACIPRAEPGWRVDGRRHGGRRGVDGRRPAACSGSSPRKRSSQALIDETGHRVGARRRGRRRSGRSSPSPTACGSRAARWATSRDAGSALAADVSYGPPSVWFVAPACVLSALTVLAGVVPSVLDNFVDRRGARPRRRGRRRPPRRVARHQRRHCPVGRRRSSAGGVVHGAAFGRSRAAAASTRPRVVERRLPRDAARPQRLRQPGRWRRPVRFAADVSRRHPADRGGRARRAAARPGDWWQGCPTSSTRRLHVPIAAVILGAAFAAAAVRRRFTAALFLGVVGYSMAGLFVIEGAPDLALTQVAIESLTTVLFVLVLRRLPDRFESRRAAVAALDPVRDRRGRRPHGVRAWRWRPARSDPPTPASDAMIERSRTRRRRQERRQRDPRRLPRLRHARRDHRAGRRRDRHGGVGPGRATPGRPTTASGSAEPAVPPPVPVAGWCTLEVSMRLLFTVVMVGSLYLLFVGHNQPGGGFVGRHRRGRRDRVALHQRRHRRGAHVCRGASRGSSLGGGLLIAVVTATRAVAVRRSRCWRAPTWSLASAAARHGQDLVGAGLRRRRLSRRRRAGDDDVRVVRRRPAAARATSGGVPSRCRGRSS